MEPHLQGPTTACCRSELDTDLVYFQVGDCGRNTKARLVCAACAEMVVTRRRVSSGELVWTHRGRQCCLRLGMKKVDQCVRASGRSAVIVQTRT